MHAKRNDVEFLADSMTECFPIIENAFLRYVPLESFASNTDEKTALTCSNVTISESNTLNRTKAVIDKVHRHVCGYANFAGMRLLLQRKKKI